LSDLLEIFPGSVKVQLRPKVNWDQNTNVWERKKESNRFHVLTSIDFLEGKKIKLQTLKLQFKTLVFKLTKVLNAVGVTDFD
jgi:hypothetical protein